MRTSFVACQGVDFIHDDGANLPQVLSALGAGQEKVERLGRRHQDMRGPAEHGLSFRGWRITGPNSDSDWVWRKSFGESGFVDFLERNFEVPADIVAQCFEGGDVDDFRFIGEFPC